MNSAPLFTEPNANAPLPGALRLFSGDRRRELELGVGFVDSFKSSAVQATFVRLILSVLVHQFESVESKPRIQHDTIFNLFLVDIRSPFYITVLCIQVKVTVRQFSQNRTPVPYRPVY
jgi:hypothetical protein